MPAKQRPLARLERQDFERLPHRVHEPGVRNAFSRVRRPVIVVDASAVLELLLRTARGNRVESRALAFGERLHAPHLLDVEVAQALRRLVQLGDITAGRARQALDAHAALGMDRHTHHVLLPRIWQLRESITAYDAAYVALAEALDVPLLTRDAKLARSHGHQAKMELV
ncbi:MAG TPA: type II toxin-antitoxin system VapC family toxin [Gammaproteobacteria bacterium]|nr:type II toxin-antitoxin system VapC family toxin [Gammaproteobacteria bacterium]